MPISLRCNVFQLISSAGELRPSLADIAKRFADARNGLQYLLDGQIDLAVATGPEAVIVTYKDPVPPDGEKVVCQAVQRAPRFAELRALTRTMPSQPPAASGGGNGSGCCRS